MTRTAPAALRVPGDKSISHRALLIGALSEGDSIIEGILSGDDCRSTAGALRAMGVRIPDLGSGETELRFAGVGRAGLLPPGEPLDCGNSGTSARLLLGLLAGLGIEAVLDGDASLRSRPMRRVTDPLRALGAEFREEGEPDRLPIRALGGALEGGTVRLEVSSAQIKSALLLAGVAAGVPVAVVEPTRSRDHTERMLRRVGIRVDEGPDPDGAGWRVALVPPFSHRLLPLVMRIPGDLSSAAFLLALGVLRPPGSAPLRIEGVGVNPTRTGLLPVLERMGARIERLDVQEEGDPAGEPAATLVAHASELHGVEVGGAEIPLLIDELPLLAALAARARGTTVIRDAGELRVKESDRIRAMVENLKAIGVEAEERPDGMVIHGGSGPLTGGIQVRHDHRIAMAFGVLGALPGNRIEIDDPGVVAVSFPGFWEMLAPLGRAPIVTLDGPAGSGKSTTAKEVARRLGFRHLDSGALYRALTWALLREKIPPESWASLPPDRFALFDIRLDPVEGAFRVLLDGVDPGEALRTSEVTAGVSRLASLPAVRARLLDLQHQVRAWGGVVADGRDMGTVVFPDAEVKVFLTASLEERARRRLLQEGRTADDLTTSGEADRLEARDRSDREREVAPLRPAPDAVLLDTTGMSFEVQVDRIVDLVRGAGEAEGSSP